MRTSPRPNSGHAKSTRARRKQEAPSDREVARQIQQSAMQVTICAQLQATLRNSMVVSMPLLACGMNNVHEYIALVRFLASVDHANCAFPALDGTVEAEDDTCFILLSPSAVDHVWCAANTLILRIKSLGIAARLILPYQSIRFAIPSTTMTQLVVNDKLEWHQLVIERSLSTMEQHEETNSSMILQRRWLNRPCTMMKTTDDSTIASSLRNPNVFYWLQHHTTLLDHSKLFKKLILVLRGIPGSGKSSLGRDVARLCDVYGRSYVICSADCFFETARGYQFDVKRIGDAHAMAQHQFTMALHDPTLDVLVVDNTHTQYWEYATYESLAAMYSVVPYDLYIWELDCPSLVTCMDMAKRNSHGVPMANVLQMFMRFEADARSIRFPAQGLEKLPRLHKNPVSDEFHQQLHSHVAYVGLFLDPDARASLLERFKPQHVHVIAEHVTLCYRPSWVTVRSMDFGRRFTVRIHQEVSDDQGHTLAVSINDSSLRPRNKVPHITVSLAENVSAYYSNELLEKSDVTKEREEWTVDMALGAVLVANNKRKTTTTSVFPVAQCPSRQEIVVVVLDVDEQLTDKCNSTATYVEEQLVLLQEVLEHRLGNGVCPTTKRYLCTRSASVDNVLAFMDQYCTLHQRNDGLFDEIVTMNGSERINWLDSILQKQESRDSLVVTMLELVDAAFFRSPAKRQAMEALDQQLSQWIAKNPISVTLERLPILASRVMPWQVAPVLLSLEPATPVTSSLIAAMDCLGLGVQEETRATILRALDTVDRWMHEAATDCSATWTTGRLDATVNGLFDTSDVIPIGVCFESSSSSGSLETMQSSFLAAWQQSGVHGAVNDPNKHLYFRLCGNKASTSPVFCVRLFESNTAPWCWRFVQQQRQRICSLRNELYEELYSVLVGLMRPIVSARCRWIDPVAMTLWAEHLVLLFLHEYNVDSRLVDDAEAMVSDQHVVQCLIACLQFFSHWSAPEWSAAWQDRSFPPCYLPLFEKTMIKLISDCVAIISSLENRWRANRDRETTSVLSVLRALVQPCVDGLVHAIVMLDATASLFDRFLVLDQLQQVATKQNEAVPSVVCRRNPWLKNRLDVYGAPNDQLSRILQQQSDVQYTLAE